MNVDLTTPLPAWRARQVLEDVAALCATTRNDDAGTPLCMRALRCSHMFAHRSAESDLLLSVSGQLQAGAPFGPDAPFRTRAFVELMHNLRRQCEQRAPAATQDLAAAGGGDPRLAHWMAQLDPDGQSKVARYVALFNPAQKGTP